MPGCCYPSRVQDHEAPADACAGLGVQDKEAGLKAEQERMALDMDRLRQALDDARRDAALAQHDTAQRNATLEVRVLTWGGRVATGSHARG